MGIEGLSWHMVGFPAWGIFPSCWLWCHREFFWFWEWSGSFPQSELSSTLLKLDCKMLFDIIGSGIAAEVLL